jgi:hypothetical protein
MLPTHCCISRSSSVLQAVVPSRSCSSPPPLNDLLLSFSISVRIAHSGILLSRQYDLIVLQSPMYTAYCVTTAQHAILVAFACLICQQPTLPNTAAAAGGISSLLYRGVTAAAYYSIRSFLNKTIRRGKLTLVCPDGSEFSCGDSNAPPNKQVMHFA